MMPLMTLERINRAWSRWCSGKALMVRVTVSGASRVCSVLITRWPVSAAMIAVSMVSRSRISPTRMTSGFCRSAALSAEAKSRVS